MERDAHHSAILLRTGTLRADRQNEKSGQRDVRRTALRFLQWPSDPNPTPAQPFCLTDCLMDCLTDCLTD
jgi:hypothetical protein